MQCKRKIALTTLIICLCTISYGVGSLGVPPCNPIPPPISITDQTGDDVSTAKYIKSGVHYWKRDDGEVQKFIVITNIK